MKVLMIGDVVGSPGRRIFKERIPALRRELGLAAVVVNAENAAAGFENAAGFSSGAGNAPGSENAVASVAGSEKAPVAGFSSGSENLLFATHTCPNCLMAVRLMDEADFDYREVFSEDEQDLARVYGVETAPTLIIGSTGEKLVGFGPIRGYVLANREEKAV